MKTKTNAVAQTANVKIATAPTAAQVTALAKNASVPAARIAANKFNHGGVLHPRFLN